MKYCNIRIHTLFKLINRHVHSGLQQNIKYMNAAVPSKSRPKHYYLIHHSPAKTNTINEVDKSNNSVNINIFKDVQPKQDYFPTCPDINPLSSTEPAPSPSHAQVLKLTLNLSAPKQDIQIRRTIDDQTIYKQSIINIKKYHSNLHKLDKLKSSSTINHNHSYSQRKQTKTRNTNMNKANTITNTKQRGSVSDRRAYITNRNHNNNSNEDIRGVSNLNVDIDVHADADVDADVYANCMRNSNSDGNYHQQQHHGNASTNVNTNINKMYNNSDLNTKDRIYIKGKTSNMTNNINKYLYSKAIVSEIVYNQDLRTRCGAKYFEQDLRDRHRQQMKPMPYVYALPANSDTEAENTKLVKQVRQMHPYIRIKQKMKVIGVNVNANRNRNKNIDRDVDTSIDVNRYGDVNRRRVCTEGSELNCIDVMLNHNKVTIQQQQQQQQ